MIPELPDDPGTVPDAKLLALRRELKAAVDQIGVQLATWKNRGEGDVDRRRRTLDALTHAKRNLRAVKDEIQARSDRGYARKLAALVTAHAAEVERLRAAVRHVQLELSHRMLADEEGRDTLVKHFCQAVLDGHWRPKASPPPGGEGEGLFHADGDLPTV